MRAHIRREALRDVHPGWFVVPLAWALAITAAIVFLYPGEAAVEAAPAEMPATAAAIPALPELQPQAQMSEHVQAF